MWVPAGGLDECLITLYESKVNIELGYMGNGQSKTNLPAIINYAANITIIALWPSLYGDFCPRLLHYAIMTKVIDVLYKQLEHTSSEIPLTYPYSWFTSDPMSKQDKVKVTKLKKNYQQFKFWNFARNFICDTPSEVVDKMYKYKMDPTRTVGTTERTQDAGRTDGRKEWN